jgi:hypothetical protein
MDRSTKALLWAIAIGVWLNAAIQVLTVFGVQQVASDVSFLEAWVIRGAPVTTDSK